MIILFCHVSVLQQSPVIDPCLEMPGHDEALHLASNPSSSTGLHELPREHSRQSSAEPSGTTRPHSERSSPTKGDSQRVTTENPSHGLVEGSKRGNEQWSMYNFAICNLSHHRTAVSDVVRTQPLRPLIMDSNKAAKRFARCMEDIVVRVRPIS